MSYYEYRVVPAPKTLPKVKGEKRPEGRFAFSMAEALNAEGREGWEFQRSETIETEVRQGFLSKRTRTVLTVLVFRRWVETVDQSDPAAPPAWSAPPPQEEVAPVTRVPEPEADRPYPSPEQIERGTTDPAPDEERPVFSARRTETGRDIPPLTGPWRD